MSNPPFPPDTDSTASDPRWARVLDRDKTADETFWYSVLTTGIFCRPSCPSRHARPENVRLHDSLFEARASGARPCKRCNPEGASRDLANIRRIERACRTLSTAEQAPNLGALAAQAGLSSSHFHRLFKTVTGITPKAYADAARAGRMRQELDAAPTVTDAIYAAGFQSSSRFYDRTDERLGMTPTRYRSGGANETLRFAVGESVLGAILVATSDKGVAAILLGDDAEELLIDLQDRFPRAELVGGDAAFEAYVAMVVGMIEAPGTAAGLALDLRGTAFQQRVWKALRDIPFGKTATYAEIADAIGSPASVRAVARACGANAHALAIPCHRVIRSDGGLSGYRWGVERKAAILEREALTRQAA